MKKPAQVFKFGGASLRDADGIRNVGNIVEVHRDLPLVIVVSAFSGVTNRLEEVAGAHFHRTGAAAGILEEIRLHHLGIMEKLFAPGDPVFAEVEEQFLAVGEVLSGDPGDHYDFMYDQIVCLGELASSIVVAAYLKKIGLPLAWLDARELILTDDIYREGWVQWVETEDRCEQFLRPTLVKTGMVLTQGFIGSTADHHTTTLGREGSDYTAAILSYCLNAESMTIWKDVPGVLTADPRLFDNVVKLDRLSYREAIEMTYYGAKVIHPKTIKPLQNKSIPLYVKSFIKPEEEGTCISGDVDDLYPPIVTVERNQAMLQISTRDFSFVAEHHISQMFRLIADLRLQVNMMQNSAISFSVCFNDMDDKVDRFMEELQTGFKITATRGLELITVRHYREETLESLKKGKILLLEERFRHTTQMVVKDVPLIRRKGQED
jgi:aspartate kinase